MLEKTAPSSSSKTLPVSVIILAHVESAKLHRAIASSAWAQEILVIPTSIDKSKKHSTHFNQVEPARYLTAPASLTHFDEVRNWALTQATQDWVFFLDSDEVFPASHTTQQIIAPVLAKKNLAGLFITRQDIFLGQALHWGEAGHTMVVRLMRKDQAHFSGYVHEVAVVSGATQQIPLLIAHFSHDSISSFLEKINFYSRLVAENNLQHGQTFQLPELLILPPAKFIFNYFLKLGCLDGWRGLVYALLMSIHSASVRAYMYEKTQS